MDGPTMQALEWTVRWAMWGWAILIGLILAFELYCLWWNHKYGHDRGQRANLTAYAMAFFRTHDRYRLRYTAGPAVLIALFCWFIVHFLGWERVWDWWKNLF